MQNNTFSKFEKKVIKSILKYKRKGVESIFKELFEHILNIFFEDIGIQINKRCIELSFYSKIETENIIKNKEKIYELILLIKKLREDYNFFYNIPNKVSNFEHCLDRNRNIMNNTKIELERDLSDIINLIFSNYFITSDLKDLKKINFNSIERRNLEWTKYALIIGAIFSCLTFGLEIYQAIGVNEVEILNLKEMKNNINIFILR